MARKSSKSKKVTKVAEKVSKKGHKVNLVKDIDSMESNDLIKSDNEELVDTQVDDLDSCVIEEKASKKEKKTRKRKADEIVEGDHVMANGKGDNMEVDNVTNKVSNRGKRANKKAVKLVEPSEENDDLSQKEVEAAAEVEIKAVKGTKGKPAKKEPKIKPSKGKIVKDTHAGNEIHDKNEEEDNLEPIISKGRKTRKGAQKVKPSKIEPTVGDLLEIEESSKDDSPKNSIKAKTSNRKLKVKPNKDVQNENIGDAEVEKKVSKTRARKGKQNIENSPVEETEKNDSSKENIEEGMEVEEIETSKPIDKKGVEPKGKRGKQRDDLVDVDLTKAVKLKIKKANTKKDKALKVDIKSNSVDTEEETAQFKDKDDDKKSSKSKGKRGKNTKVPKLVDSNLDIEEETMNNEVKEDLGVEDNPKPKAKGRNGKAKGKKDELSNEKANLNIKEDTTEGTEYATSEMKENGQSEQEVQKPIEKRGNNQNSQSQDTEDDNKGKRNNNKRKPKDKQVEEEPTSKKPKTEDDEAQKDSKKKAPLKNKATTNYNDVDFSNTSKNAKGQEWNFKIANWNIDGVRAWLAKGGLEYIEYEKPDILCLQEIKCSKEKMPKELLNIPGYHTYYECSKTEGYAGVAVCTSNLAMNVVYGLKDDELDQEGRIITAEYEQFYLICTYVPNAGRKLVTMPKRLKWNEAFKRHVKELDKQKPVIICGDMNVAHNEIDLSNPKTNRKNAGFTDEERAGMTDLLGDGFIDTFRHLYPDKTDAYTFWTYMMNSRSKNVGWRLDYFIISERLLPSLCDNVIRNEVFGSDHCPLSLFMHLTSAVKPKSDSS